MLQEKREKKSCLLKFSRKRRKFQGEKRRGRKKGAFTQVNGAKVSRYNIENLKIYSATR